MSVRTIRRREWLRWLVAAGLAPAAGWMLEAGAIRPARQREVALRHEAAALRAQVDGAREIIRETGVHRQAAEDARGELQRLQKQVPHGPPMVWLPELIKTHFERAGIPPTVIRFNTAVADPGLPGYLRGYWSVALPIAPGPKQVSAALFAVAALETTHSFIRVCDFTIGADPEKLDARVASLNLTALFEN